MKLFFGLLVTLLLLVGSSEDDSIEELTQKFNTYNSVFPQNKLILSFNQPAYAPGDTVFFKAHLLTEDLTPVKGRQIMYLVLIDTEGNEIIRESFAIDRGICSSQTVIPEEFSAGVYKLVAYTNWMKNFSSDLYFTSFLTVSGENYFVTSNEGPVKIELFPEGSNWITGLPLQVVAVATKNGAPIAAEGVIIDNAGNQVNRFRSDKSGLSSFELTLSEGIQYSLLLPDGTKTPLKASSEGYSLQVIKEADLIIATISFQSRKDTKENVFVVATARGKIRYASMVNVSKTQPAKVLIPLKNIPEGIIQISLLDSKLNEVASRLSFVENENETTVAINFKSENVGTRDIVSFSANVSDKNGKKLQSDYFIKAYYNNLFSGIETRNFREQLLVACDIPDAQYFLDKIDIDSEEGRSSLDQFLIAKKWKRFSWDEVLSDKRKEPEFSTQDIITYEGIATLKQTGKPVPDSTIVMFFLQKNVFGYEVYSRNNGRVTWPVYFDFYGNDNVMYSMESKGRDLMNTSVKLLKDSLTGFVAPNVVQSNQKDPYYSFNQLVKVANTAYGYSWNKEEAKVINNNPNAAIEDELNGADFSIKVDDYVVLPTMEDLFREIVRFVQNRKIGGKQTLRVLSTDSNNPMMGDPLYVVDGVATKNTDFILNMKPGDIAIIKVINDVKKLRNLGNFTKNGVVFIQTKVANMGDLIPRDDILNVRGLNKAAPFSLGLALPSSSRTPYLKSTVYWNTNPVFNESGLLAGEFRAADNTGPIKFKVQGITSDGIPFEKEQLINVSFAKSSN